MKRNNKRILFWAIIIIILLLGLAYAVNTGYIKFSIPQKNNGIPPLNSITIQNPLAVTCSEYNNMDRQIGGEQDTKKQTCLALCQNSNKNYYSYSCDNNDHLNCICV
ncbi:Uncharacterised protein [uncultured archaeon]|nr:Uncharacterised protein [uncultured archaeon]